MINVKLQIGRLITSVRDWWKRLRRFHSFQGVTICEADVDPNKDLTARKLVLIGSAERYKWLRFKCPCRCGEIIALNLMQSYRPRWSVTMGAGQSLSVSPSIVATSCGSHFWIRENRIDWV